MSEQQMVRLICCRSCGYAYWMNVLDGPPMRCYACREAFYSTSTLVFTYQQMLSAEQVAS